MSTTELLEVGPVVVGAGIVGLAVAAELAQRDLSPIVLERRSGPGRETSGRNSGVVHAGLYYPEGSLKARFCVRGKGLLEAFCAGDGIALRRLGKLVVATSDDEVPTLEALARRAMANGAEVELVDASRARRLEPRVRAVAALHSPTTGVVDVHELIKAFEGRVRGRGGEVLYRYTLIEAEAQGDGWALLLETPDGGHERVWTPWVVNAAGLDSDRIAALLDDDRWSLHWCRGDYFSVPGGAARDVRGLIYPLPSNHGLGIHATIDLGGRLLFGPDTTYVPRNEAQADVDVKKAVSFRDAAASFLPHVATVEFTPDTWGIRPKLQAPGGPFADFVIAVGRAAVHLVGIESPGMTAAMAIAEEVSGRLDAAGLLSGSP
ncbi:MAG: NAD(P)/FAD-dependent oxidoreductase [Deltaproteobacteria bacterium]|nr:NAD(P)/FAD-dependent oxidoreductase [Deltaproteobacteria bacterium]